MNFRPVLSAMLVSALVFSIGGCAAPSSPQQYSLSADSLNQERDLLRVALSERQVKRSKANVQSEIDRLNDEVRDLESRIAALDVRISAEEARLKAQYTPPASSSGCLVGPRGGRYTISKSGKKNYGGC